MRHGFQNSHRRGRGFGGAGDGFDANPRGQRRGGGRFFAQGGLRLVLLSLIAQKPSHGYELIKAIEDQLEGAYSPSPGVVYPTLTWIEELGYATLTLSEDGRKLYSITQAGQTFLEENAEAAQAAFARINSVRGRNHERPAPIVRAIENFKTALHLRLSGEPLSKPQIEALADLLDKAARDVERI